MSRRGLLRIGLTLLAAAGSVSHAQAQGIEWTLGASTAAGRYIFEQTTLSHVLTLGGAVTTERWRFGAALPIVVQNSSAVTFIGGTPIPTGGGGGGPLSGRRSGQRLPMRRRSSALMFPGQASATVVDSVAEAPGPYTTQLGDPVLSASRSWHLNALSPHRVTTNLFVKLPLADANSGVGSGALDAGASLSYGATMGRTFLFADAGWWHIGDLEAIELRDIVTGSLGVGRALDSRARWTTMLSLSGATSVVPNLDAPLAANAMLGFLPRPDRGFTVGFSAGLSEASPDWSASLGWRISRGR